MSFVEAIWHTIDIAKEASFISRNFRTYNVSPFTREEYAELMLLLEDSLIPQIDAFEAESLHLVKLAEEWASSVKTAA